uniref:Ribosomal protein n=1 Tax=Steinernema glaseri TaxID=37863 RepID=A0A1I7Z1K6_9BILA
MSGLLNRLVSGAASALSSSSRQLLGTKTAQVQNHVSGFKVKSMLKLRCRSCYFVRVDGRLHVECPVHPRHKQREMFNVKLLW